MQALPLPPRVEPNPAAPEEQPPAPPPPSSVLAKPRGLLTMRSLRVAGRGAEGSRVYFGRDRRLSLGTDSAGNFVVEQAGKPVPFFSLDSQNTLRLGAQRVEAWSLEAAGGLSVRGVRQWQLVHVEDFSSQGAGWSRSQVSRCAGVEMLGGFCLFSRGEVNKTFVGLPPHQQLRVVATYHFIDRWIGESGYMKLDIGQNACPTVVWSEQHAQQESRNGVNVCGQNGTPEGKFAVPIDVTVPHHQDSVQLTFGSTMDGADPCDESWGVSGVELHVRL